MADKKSCSDAILKAFPELSKKAVGAIMEEVENIRSNVLENSEGLPASEFRQKVMKALEDRRYQQAAAMKETLENVLKAHKLEEFVKQPAFEKDPVEAVKAVLGGTARYSKGGNASIGQTAENMRAEGLAILWNSLDRAGDGLKEIAIKGTLDREIAQALHEMRDGGNLDNIKSKQAVEIAKIYKLVNDYALQIKQLSGSAVRELTGYITAQSHNPLKIQAAGFENWFKSILPRLDIEKTFGPSATTPQIRAGMEGVFKDIVSGKYDAPVPENVTEDMLTKNISKQTSQARSLHFKDGNAWYDYNQEFGSKGLLESIQSNVMSSARQSALMYRLGTNPEASFRALKDKIRFIYKDAPDVLKKFNENEHTMDSWMDQAMGYGSMPGTSLAAKTGQQARAITSMSKLGTAVLRSISDTAYGISTLRAANGKNVFENASNLISQFFSSMGSEERTKWATRLGTAIDDFHGHLYTEMGAADPTQPGQIAQVQRLLGKLTSPEAQKFFMKASLHTQRMDAAKVAMAKLLSTELADHAGSSFAAIPDRIRLGLERYGIDDSNWKHISDATETYENGVRAITPEAIQKMDPEKFPGGEKQRFDLKQSLLSYLNDQANMGANSPGLRQAATLIRGTPDEGVGIIYRLLAQFKQVPLMAMDTSKRILLSNPQTMPKNVTDALLRRQGDMAGLAQHIALATVLGYVGMSLKDIATGKTPRDPYDQKTALEAMVQGGAGGLYGDIIFGEFNRKRSAADAMLGPVLGQGASLLDLFSQAREGKAKADDAFKLLWSDVPFQNVFYTKAALDRMIVNSVHEYLNPGYLRRQAQAVHQNPGLLSPHQEIIGGSP